LFAALAWVAAWGAKTRAVAGLAADVSDHCYAPSHVSLTPDSISNHFTRKQKGVAGIGHRSEAAPQDDRNWFARALDREPRLGAREDPPESHSNATSEPHSGKSRKQKAESRNRGARPGKATQCHPKATTRPVDRQLIATLRPLQCDSNATLMRLQGSVLLRQACGGRKNLPASPPHGIWSPVGPIAISRRLPQPVSRGDSACS
jgi:hypothetical protein